MAQPFNFHPDNGIGDYIQLFDAHPGRADPAILQANVGNAGCHSLHQVDMAVMGNGPDTVANVFVTDHSGQVIMLCSWLLQNPKVNIDTDPLGSCVFVFVDADQARYDHIAYEDVADPVRCIGNGWYDRLYWRKNGARGVVCMVYGARSGLG